MRKDTGAQNKQLGSKWINVVRQDCLCDEELAGFTSKGPPGWRGSTHTLGEKAKHMERRGSSPSRSYVPGFKLLDVFGPMVKLLRMK